MRKNFVTIAATIAVFGATSLPALADGLGTPEIEPDVFVDTDAVAAGSLGSNAGIILVGLLIGGLAIAGDSN